MECIYLYKGHKFDSEPELNDFLIEREPLESQLGDIVFEQTPEYVNSIKTIEESKKVSDKIVQDYIDASKEAKKQREIQLRQLNADEFENKIEGLVKKPYIGTTDLIGRMTKLDGSLLFPNFIEDNYINRRALDWKKGLFLQTEIVDFFGSTSSVHSISSAEEIAACKAKLERRWESLHLIGSELHKGLELFWSAKPDKNGKLIRDYHNVDFLTKYLSSKLNKDLVSEDRIRELAVYAYKLYDTAIKMWGKDAKFYPEYKIVGDTNYIDEKGDKLKALGIIDLLVVDSKGKVHCIDYKASYSDYAHFSSAKRQTYKYQFGLYNRLLNDANINVAERRDNAIMVAPIQLVGFGHSIAEDKWTYRSVIPGSNNILEDVSSDVLSEGIMDNIERYVPTKIIPNINSENMSTYVMNLENEFFGQCDMDDSEETLARIFREGHTIDEATGIHKFKYKGEANSRAITANSEKELYNKFKSIRALNKVNLENRAKYLSDDLMQAIKEGESFTFQNASSVQENGNGSLLWWDQQFSRYANPTWEVIPFEQALKFGIILLRNKATYQIDVIKLTNNLTKETRAIMGKNGVADIKTGTTLFANFRSDIEEKSKTNSYALRNVNGNMELIESMLILNNIGKQVFAGGYKLGRIRVVNPNMNSALSAENYELLYNFNELDKFCSVGTNHFKDGTIKMMTHFDLARCRFLEIIRNIDKSATLKKFNNYISIVNEMDNVGIDPEKKMQELMDLKTKMENDPLFKKALINVKGETSNNPENAVYNEVMLAIAELKGYTFRQQLSDHAKFFNAHLFRLSGTYIDNPGNLESNTLNVVTAMVTEAYQNVRSDLERDKTKIQELVENLKREKGFSFLKEITFGNQADLYKNIIEERDGDLFIKNPNAPGCDMTQAEKEFAAFFAESVYKRRFPERMDTIDKYKNDDEYWLLPLAPSNMRSIASTKGLLNALKDKLKDWNPKFIVERIKERAEGLFNATQAEEHEINESQQALWKMTNMFDIGYKDNRKQKIAEKGGLVGFETNLETLLLQFEFAESMQRNLNDVFPVIKAAMISLATSGELQNDQFKDDLQYLQDYVKNKIFNRSINPAKYRPWVESINKLMVVATRMALGFAPVQFSYQMLEGIWKDASLVYRKPDLKDPNGKSAFTASNVRDAYFTAIRDLVHSGNKKTLCQLLNELYGLNDMDMNNYIDHIKSDVHGFWNFWNHLAFKFASRPDYYNRLTIFGAQMRGDGCWEAHSIVDGRLKYDWTKDKRFSVFSKGEAGKRENLEEYKKQEGLYWSMAKQMVLEHTKNFDGTDFKLDYEHPMALPKAYTTQQSEGYKSLSDKLYGYYAHEKKSMIHATMVGAMFMQMRTYWSGKKNQYIAPGGIHVMGHMEQYEENGQKYWYKLDENGNVTEMPTTEDTGIPFMVWRGQWEEGIASTLMSFMHASIAGFKENGIAGAKKIVSEQLWNNPNDNLRTAYRANVKQLGYDLAVWLGVGLLLSNWILKSLADDSKKQAKEDQSLSSALSATTMEMFRRTFKNSTDDFNAFGSITGLGVNWTPFSITYLTNVANMWDTAIGNGKIHSALVNSVSFTKQTRPFWDYIDPADPSKTKSDNK
jgi:hypothetical protein